MQHIEKLLIRQITHQFINTISNTYSKTGSNPNNSIISAITLASQPHASSCLRIPISRSSIPFASSLGNSDVAVFCALRLGDHLPGRDSNSLCRCGLNPAKMCKQHSISAECTLNIRTTLTHRHDNIKLLLHNLVMAAGGHSVIEPTFIKINSSGKHVDLYIYLPNATGARSFMLDVSICSTTLLMQTQSPLSSITNRANAKKKKYLPIAQAHRMIVVPAVMHVNGVFHDDFLSFLSILADHSHIATGVAKKDFFEYSLFALSTCLAQQNSLAHFRNTLMDIAQLRTIFSSLPSLISSSSSSNISSATASFLSSFSHPLTPPMPAFASAFPVGSRVSVLHDNGKYYDGFVIGSSTLKMIELDDGDTFSFMDIASHEIKMVPPDDPYFVAIELSLLSCPYA